MSSWIFIVLAHWNNSKQIDMLLHSQHIILIPSLLSLCSFSCMLSKEAKNTNFIFIVWPDQGWNRQSRTLWANTLTITPPMWLIHQWRCGFWRGTQPAKRSVNFYLLVLYNHSHPPIQKLTRENLSPLWDLAQSPTPGLQDASHITMYTL
jgi:hypothetical protein